MDSSEGSSGGPLINSINFQVIGIHKGRAKGTKIFNFGTLIKKPIEEFNEEIKSKQKKTFIDSIRANMINNALKKIHLDSLEISDAIEQNDLSILTEETCKLLLPIIPTEKEIKDVSQFNGDILKDLNIADLDILMIFGFKERIKAILFYYNYKENS